MRVSRKKRRKPQISGPVYRCNERIRASEVRVIDQEEGHLGAMPTAQALKLAEEKKLDLVEVDPKAQPPITKLMDFGQFKYQKEKEARKLKAKQHKVDLKGIRLSVRISQHDQKIRLDKTKKFLEEGDKVKIEIILRGREKRHPELAREKIESFIKTLEQELKFKIEQPITRQGGTVTAIVAKE